MIPKKKILIADDCQDLVDIYSMMIGDRYEIIEAFDGQKAVDLYKKHRPDLTLMDIKMPFKSGEEAIREIFVFDPGARIIAVTAYRYTEKELGVPVIRKGFSKKALVSLVESFFQRQTDEDS